jgi:NADPH-dependent 2,4-dienoyl-CoA reductase/sulfur reductase-like enzyme
MATTRYLVVGGGMTADAACKGIRAADPEGAIVLVGEEPHPPYDRPPLSKALWKGTEEEAIWRKTEDAGVELRTGRRIVALDVDRRTATDDRGEAYGFEKVLLATGGRPRTLPFGGDDVLYFRTIDDYRTLRAQAEGGARFVVIGGGFIGSELAAALAMNGRTVTIVFPEPGICSRVFPDELSAAVTDHYREQGVEVVAGASVSGIERSGGVTRVSLEGGRVLEADGVVAGLGIEPRVDLAEQAGLTVDNGVAVDAYGRVVGREDVFAAGDVARFPVAALGTAMRVEHEDHANSHGRRVGENMGGAAAPYDHLPFFYSDLFDLGYEAVGDLDSRLDTLSEVDGLTEQGVVYYLDAERRPRGVLLWNTFGRVDDARALIAAGRPVERGALG